MERKRKIYISKWHHTSPDDRRQQNMMYMRKRRLKKYLKSPDLPVRIQAYVDLYITYGGNKDDLQGIITFIYSQEVHRQNDYGKVDTE